MITCLTSGSARRTPVHDPRTLKLADYRTGALTAPAQAHWGHGLPFTMLGQRFGR